MCVLRLLLCVAAYTQSGHGNVTPSWTDLMCLWRPPFCLVVYSQYWHENVSPLWTDLMCLWRLQLVVALYIHSMHGNLWPSWIDLMWVWRFLLCDALYSQSGQGKVLFILFSNRFVIEMKQWWQCLSTSVQMFFDYQNENKMNYTPNIFVARPHHKDMCPCHLLILRLDNCFFI